MHNQEINSDIPFCSCYQVAISKASAGTEKETHPLELIIRRATDILMSILDDAHHPFRRLPLIQSESEPIPQPSNRRFALERRKPGLKHEMHGADKLVGIGTDGEEGLRSKLLEELVALRVSATHECHHLVVKLE